jgi:hypothetical protein
MTEQDNFEEATTQSYSPAVRTVNAATEQEILAQIQQLWPSARKSGKALGEQLFVLREICRDKEAHFNELLQSLQIPRSTAYHYIGIFEECQLVDFEFPSNLVRFATTAGIDIVNSGHRKTLLIAFQEAGSPPEPNDASAIAIVGSASTAIRTAIKEANKQETPHPLPLTPFEKMLVAFTTAHVESYKVLVGSKKEVRVMDETTKAAKEAKYVQSTAEMSNLDVSIAAVRTKILAVGRGEQTLQGIYEEWKHLPVKYTQYTLTQQTAPVYTQGGDAA